MVTTRQKSVVDTYKKMRKGSKHNTIEIHETTEKLSNDETKRNDKTGRQAENY